MWTSTKSQKKTRKEPRKTHVFPRILPFVLQNITLEVMYESTQTKGKNFYFDNDFMVGGAVVGLYGRPSLAPQLTSKPDRP
jgi:hypothetical protein